MRTDRLGRPVHLSEQVRTGAPVDLFHPLGGTRQGHVDRRQDAPMDGSFFMDDCSLINHGGTILYSRAEGGL